MSAAKDAALLDAEASHVCGGLRCDHWLHTREVALDRIPMSLRHCGVCAALLPDDHPSTDLHLAWHFRTNTITEDHRP